MRAAAQIAKNEYEYKSIHQLGVSILVQAAKDAFMEKPTLTDRKTSRFIKSDAISFLTDDSRKKDLDIICQIAGVSSDAIQKEARKFIEKGVVDVEKFFDLSEIRKRLK